MTPEEKIIYEVDKLLEEIKTKDLAISGNEPDNTEQDDYIRRIEEKGLEIWVDLPDIDIKKGLIYKFRKIGLLEVLKYEKNDLFYTEESFILKTKQPNFDNFYKKWQEIKENPWIATQNRPKKLVQFLDTGKLEEKFLKQESGQEKSSLIQCLDKLIEEGINIGKQAQEEDAIYSANDNLLDDVHRRYNIWKGEIKDSLNKEEIVKEIDISIFYQADSIPRFKAGIDYGDITSKKSKKLLRNIRVETNRKLENLRKFKSKLLNAKKLKKGNEQLYETEMDYNSKAERKAWEKRLDIIQRIWETYIARGRPKEMLVPISYLTERIKSSVAVDDIIKSFGTEGCFAKWDKKLTHRGTKNYEIRGINHDILSRTLQNIKTTYQKFAKVYQEKTRQDVNDKCLIFYTKDNIELKFNKENGYVKFGKAEGNLAPKTQEYKVFLCLLESSSHKAEDRTLLKLIYPNKDFASLPKYELGIDRMALDTAIKKIKEVLGILPKKKAINENIIRRFRKDKSYYLKLKDKN